jgi:hypothetical protein
MMVSLFNTYLITAYGLISIDMTSELHQDGDLWFICAQINIPRAWDIMWRNPGRDYSDITKTRNARQWRPGILHGADRAVNLKVKQLIRDHNINCHITELGQYHCIDYPPGGHQLRHAHNTFSITTVLYFDDDDSELTLELGDKKWSYPSRRGQLLIMDGRIFHEAAPVVTRKRVLVLDWGFR